MKRIDLFMPPLSQYSVLHHFTRKLGEAFINQGLKSNVLEAERENPEPFLNELFGDSPDCTLSFNGLLPDEEGRFFADMIKIPHVAFVVDSPNQYYPLARSNYTIVASVDRFYCNFFKGLGCQHVIFVPHGVEKDLNFDPQEKRIFDVSFLGTCFDYEKIRSGWKKEFSSEVCAVMDEAAEIFFSDNQLSYIQAFVQAVANNENTFQQLDPNTLNYPMLFDQLELYIRAKDRIELIKSIDRRVDIFGSAHSQLWHKYVDPKKVVIHDQVPFEEALEVMKKSKVILNSAPHLRHGSHERVFTGFACGAAVISSESEYLKENFGNNKSLCYYSTTDRRDVNTILNKLLSNESERAKMVALGRQEVMAKHTWDHRAKTLVQELDPILVGVG